MDILCTIREHIEKDDGYPIYLLSGPAGSGKSTIAQTIAKECDDKGTLAASFFFTQGEALLDNCSKFFLTLAYQLATSIPSTQVLMQKFLDKDPSIPQKNLEEQFKKLIHSPVIEISTSPMVIIVDTLDECGDENAVLKLIKIITAEFDEHPFLLWFLFTSGAHHSKVYSQS
jgi:Fe-S cluster assembly ATPase SufC